ncbi:hypothetical protein PAHAL_6G001300 [Panicum hallii]|jgi:hypothetical protein|uniref:Uncharacterized protein n=1 Tax=Panicum hallii TaxID=206008 RepID=A0A2S3HZG8_9POAL|nr:hypothetical protein PAHAL_6G001300 [Panicum hallii]
MYYCSHDGVVPCAVDGDRGEHDGDAEEEHDERCEVDEHRLGAVLGQAQGRALQEGELLEEAELRGADGEREDEEAADRVPWHGPAPGGRRGARVEEGEEARGPLERVEGDGGDADPGVERVEVGDAALDVELEDRVDAEGAGGEARGVQRQVRLLPGVAGEREGAVAQDGLAAEDDGAEEHEHGVDVEDELLVVEGAEGQAAAEVDAPEQHQHGGGHGQEVRHQRARVRLLGRRRRGPLHLHVHVHVRVDGAGREARKEAVRLGSWASGLQEIMESS